ncbi:MAG: hypothetical protein HGA22_12415 [Clostridiales bacterium]|nr:hypothetical protein [Clostridiales bacterium]
MVNGSIEVNALSSRKVERSIVPGAKRRRRPLAESIPGLSDETRSMNIRKTGGKYETETSLRYEKADERILPGSEAPIPSAAAQMAKRKLQTDKTLYNLFFSLNANNSRE